MTGLNLTRDEARERARLLAVDSYEVHLDLTTGDKLFRSETVARFSANDVGASTRIDLAADTVRSVTLNGVELDPFEITVKGGLQIPGLAAENELRIVADCAYMHTGEGMHRFVDPVDGEVYLYTQFESNEAHRVYACFDQPDLKAVFTLTVDGPEHWTVLSNEPVTSIDEVREGVTRRFFAPTPKVSTYITVICAGAFHGVTDAYVRPDGSTIPLGLYCRASLGQYLDPAELIELTQQGFAFFEQQFGRPYPFTKYDQVGVAEFNAGAMENSGCVTFHEDYFVFRSKVTDALRDTRANTLLHEMAHMWFGDLVTMKWWDDLWLNESFAEFMAYHSAAEATRFSTAWTSFATGRKAWGYRQDQLPSTHPIVADAPDIETVKANFDGITYAKGASVLRQLVAWVGLEEFMSGLRAYFAKHAWGNTTLADLLVELEETSGRDLTLWSKEWLETAGCNTLRPESELGADGTYQQIAVLQDAPADHPTLRSHRIAIGLYDRQGEKLVRRRRVEIDVEGSRTQVPELIGERQADLLLINDDDLTFAKIRLDERSLATLTSDLGRLEGSLARALCWSAAWDMTRDGEMRPRDFVTLVANGAGAETDITTVQTVLQQALVTIDMYVDPEQSDASRAQLATSLRSLLENAEPGGDLQLAYARAFARAATSDGRPRPHRGHPERQTSSSTASSSTPTSAGACCDGSSRPDASRTAPSTPRSSATPPPTGSGRPRPCAPPGPRLRPRRTPGARSSSRTSWPTLSSWRRSSGSPTRGSASCCARTSSATSPRSATSGRTAPSRWPRTSRSGSIPGSSSSSRRSTHRTPTSRRRTSCRRWPDSSPRVAMASSVPCVPAPPTAR